MKAEAETGSAPEHPKDAVAPEHPSDLLARTLLQMVRLRRPDEYEPVALILVLAETAGWLQRTLRQVLDSLGTTERELAVLVVLYLLDPLPLGPADLAYHVGVSASTLRPTLNRLRAAHLISARTDRRRRGAIEFALTHEGVIHAARKLDHYLSAVAEIGRALPVSERQLLAQICAGLRHAAANQQGRLNILVPFHS